MSLAKSTLTITNATFTGATKTDLLTNIRSNLLTAGMTSIQGAAPTTVTITIASPAVVTMGSGSAPVADTRIVFSTTGALPTGLVVGTVYFVKSPSGGTFNVAATAGGAAINTSGTQSGTHTCNFELVLQTVATPQSLQIKFRFRDNGGSCVTISMENTGGSAVGLNTTTNGIHLLPAAAKTFRIICTSYYFWIFVPSSYATAREFAVGHVPWIPSTLTASTTDLGFLVGSSFNDSSTTLPGNWRSGTVITVQNNCPNWQCIFNTTLNENANSSNNNSNAATGPSQWGPTAGTPDALLNRAKFSDGSFVSFDPWMAWSTVFGDGDPRVRGMLWDAVFVMDNTPAGDTVATFDSITWTAISNAQRPTLWVISA